MSDFEDEGIRQYLSFFDKNQCKFLLEEIMRSRDFSRIFYSEEEFMLQGKDLGTNPRPGRNLAGKLNTEFIFGDERFQKELGGLMGGRYRILDYKFVMGVPRTMLPEWIDKSLGDALVANLGEYVRKEFRDITYFRGIDFHQDIIDFPDKESNFVTVYIYLDKVNEKSSPLFVLPQSHLLGATTFPHDLTKVGENAFLYKNGYGNSMRLETLRLTGEGGSMYIWHSNLLHGTQPHGEDMPRISIRILAEKNTTEISDCPIDRANKRVTGSLSLRKTRLDIDNEGKVLIKGNYLNKSV